MNREEEYFKKNQKNIKDFMIKYDSNIGVFRIPYDESIIYDESGFTSGVGIYEGKVRADKIKPAESA